MKKIKLWFIYEPTTKNGKFSRITRSVILLIRKLEKTFRKEIFDLRAIDYRRFLLESKIKIKRNELPVVIINNKVVFTKKLPFADELKQKIEKVIKKRK